MQHCCGKERETPVSVNGGLAEESEGRQNAISPRATADDVEVQESRGVIFVVSYDRL